MIPRGDTEISHKPSRRLGKRILMVEDAQPLAEVIRSMLKFEGHEVESATNGKDALAVYEPGKFDLVITDYQMPRMNGLELAEAIKTRSGDQQVLLVTAYAFSLAACGKNSLPVDFILRKPFTLDDFKEALLSLLSNKAE